MKRSLEARVDEDHSGNSERECSEHPNFRISELVKTHLRAHCTASAPQDMT